MSATQAEAAQPRIQSVARAAHILRVVAESPDGASAREISEALGLRLPTTYHLLQTLSAVGLLRRDPSGTRYVVGFAAAALAAGLERQVSVPEELHRVVRRAAAETGEAVYGSGWSDGEIVVFARAAGSHPVGVTAVPLGLAGHAHARASGKLLLALASPQELATYLERHPPVAVTPRTLLAADLEAELARIRAQGFATEEEEFAVGISCLAIPYAVGAETFAVALSAPSERFHANLGTLHETLRGIVD